jgi:hypothetical protein
MTHKFRSVESIVAKEQRKRNCLKPEEKKEEVKPT